MKIRVSELRNIIREVIEESLEEKSRASNDRDDDGDEDFADVMMARMTAGGLGHEEAYRKSRKFDETFNPKNALIFPPAPTRGKQPEHPAPKPLAPAMKRAGELDKVDVLKGETDLEKRKALAKIWGINLADLGLEK